MRFRGLLGAVAALAVLGGLVWYSQRNKDSESSGSAADAASKLVSIPEDQLTRIEVKRAIGETTVIERKDGRWEITSPKPLRADQDAAGTLASSAASLSTDHLVLEEASDLDEFGLVDPSIEVILTQKDGKSKRILIGDEAPTGSSYFVKLADDPRIFTIASYNKLALDKTGNDLRDKRLLVFDRDAVTRIELAAKGKTIEFGKNSRNEWQIVKPQPIRADGGLVDELIRKLQGAQMDALASDDDLKKAAQSFNAGSLVAIARVTDASGTQQLTVRQAADKTYYARGAAVEGVHRIYSDLAEMLGRDVDGFRNKKLFDFGWTDPSKIEIRDGEKAWSWTKSGLDWLDGARKKMDPASVHGVIDELRNLSASGFPAGGFTNAVIELTVTSDDGKRVERVQLSNTGEKWFARRENEPPVYEIEASAVESLRKAAGAVKEAAPEKK